MTIYESKESTQWSWHEQNDAQNKCVCRLTPVFMLFESHSESIQHRRRCAPSRPPVERARKGKRSAIFDSNASSLPLLSVDFAAVQHIKFLVWLSRYSSGMTFLLRYASFLGLFLHVSVGPMIKIEYFIIFWIECGPCEWNGLSEPGLWSLCKPTWKKTRKTSVRNGFSISFIQILHVDPFYFFVKKSFELVGYHKHQATSAIYIIK